MKILLIVIFACHVCNLYSAEGGEKFQIEIARQSISRALENDSEKLQAEISLEAIFDRSGQSTRRGVYHIDIGHDSRPPIGIEVPTGSLIRIGTISVLNEKVYVVIQVDEFYLKLYQYEFKGEEWSKVSENKICDLAGYFLDRIRRVEIGDDGILRVAYSNNSIGRDTTTPWDQMLLVGDTDPSEWDVIEGYIINEDGSLTPTGERHPFHERQESAE